MTAAPTAPALAARPAVLRVGLRPAIALTAVSIAGLAMFCWPLLIRPHDGYAHSADAPFVFILILPALLAVIGAELTSGGIDTKALAMLGVLSAMGAALRPLGGGTAGIELVFFLLVLAGRVYGPGFGFLLGSLTMFLSALLTGGVGPWMPFQMLGAAWVGLGAGCLPRATGRAEIRMLALYGAVAAYGYGFLLDLWSWPFVVGADSDLSYVAGAPVIENLHRFFVYVLATSTWGWDTGRAVTNVVAIVVLGPAVLTTLRRATRRAQFA